jgi:hypothetical protein
VTRRFVGLFAILVACATVPTDGARGRPARDVLGAEEIERASAGTLHDAIQLLRPHFLFTRGRASIRAPNPMQPVVIVNNVPHGSVESLRVIAPGDVLYVRLLRAPEATIRFGTGYISGVIEVVLK